MSYSLISAESEIPDPLEKTCVTRINTDELFLKFSVALESSELCAWGDAEPEISWMIKDKIKIVKGEYILYAAFAGNRMLGYCFCKPKINQQINEGVGFLDLLCAKSELNLGVGASLLRFTEIAAKNLGCHIMKVSHAMKSAVPFYIRNRYVEEEQYPRYSLMSKKL